MRYYNLSRNWTKKIMPHLNDELLNKILVEDFNKFTFGRWEKEFTKGHTPHEFESCDWWTDHRGPLPRYWHYTKHSACHWLVNFNLRLAMLASPKKKWRIIKSDRHSTVWDGKETLFDLTFMAREIPPDECFKMAYKRELKPGRYHRVNFAQHYSIGD